MPRPRHSTLCLARPALLTVAPGCRDQGGDASGPPGDPFGGPVGIRLGAAGERSPFELAVATARPDQPNEQAAALASPTHRVAAGYPQRRPAEGAAELRLTAKPGKLTINNQVSGCVRTVVADQPLDSTTDRSFEVLVQARRTKAAP